MNRSILFCICLLISAATWARAVVPPEHPSSPRQDGSRLQTSAPALETARPGDPHSASAPMVAQRR